MEFRILGRLEVVDDGVAVPLERRLVRALLACLLLHANEHVSSDRLIDLLWGEAAPRTAASSLQNHVSQLRKAIGSEQLRLDAAGYVLRVDPERFDLARFDRLVAEASAAPAKERAELLRAALVLWRGEPLEDLEFEEFAQVDIARLKERRASATEPRLDADLELGCGADLVDELVVLVSAHPERERLRTQLMIALYRAGRQADALEAYRAARRFLQDELGLEPGDALRQVHRRILEQDASLLPSVERVESGESRRTVTVLSCELFQSAQLATELDPEEYGRLMSNYQLAAQRAIEAHGGTVDALVGDALTALFGVPELHEDDALRAARAAADLRAAISRLWEERDVQPRIAIESGEVLTYLTDSGVRAIGAPIKVASDLRQCAGANEIVLGKETRRSLRDAVRTTALRDSQTAWRMDELVASTQPVARQDDMALVGRKAELRRLRSAFTRVRRDGACVVVTVLGEAGIGKSRLAGELLKSLEGGVQALIGRCTPYGAGATYLPFAQIVSEMAPEPSADGIAALLREHEDAERIAQRVAEVVGIAEGPAAPGEAFLTLRRFLEALACEKPVVVVLDDLHWAERTLLDLVEYLGGWARAPILLLCLARRELLESRPSWGGPASNGIVVELNPLTTDEIGTLLEQRSGGAILPALREEIVERAGGNPLFAEQLLALADEAPDLPLEKAPATVEALIAERLDRVEPGELELLRCASVIGRLFTLEELQDLYPATDAHLAAVVRRGFVRPPDRDREYRFHHALVRDVAYGGMPKLRRAALHEQAADNLERYDAADEAIGYHLERAYRYRAELRRDDRARRLAQAAGERLGRAGIRAWKRADAPATVELLSRAVELLPVDHASRRDLLCELAAALRASGDYEGAEQALSGSLETALEYRDRRIELRARVELSNLRAFADAREVSRVIELAEQAIPQLEIFGDERSLGRVWLALGHMKGAFRGENAALEAAAAKAAEYYRRGGWSPSTCLGALGSSLYYGPCPVPEAIERSDQLLEVYAGDGASEANIAVWLGGLHGMRGRFDLARELVAQARGVYADLGQRLAADGTCGLVLGSVELLAGRLHAAEDAMRLCCETCEQLNEHAWLASRAAELADLLCAQSRFDEARSWAELAEKLAGPEDLDAQSSWRSVSARIAARSDEVDRGRQLAEEAVAISEQTDALNHRANVLMSLAEVMRVAGLEEHAAAALTRAARLYERKGNVVSAALIHERPEAARVAQ